MKILALDLGKSKTVVCIYESQTAEHRVETIGTTVAEIDELLDRERSRRPSGEFPAARIEG